MSEKYNGWANYATWRVNLECVDGDESYVDCGADDISELADCIQENIETIVSENAEGVALDYAMAFLHEVNWYEIAEHVADDYEMFTDDEEEEDE